MRRVHATLSVVLAVLAFPSAAPAQPARMYVGGAVDLVTQTDSDSNSMGGTTWGGRALIGVWLSPHVAVEFEPSFNGSYSREYTYRPMPSATADVVATRRDAFLSGQARIRSGALEPVIGFSYVRGELSRHATVGTGTYFDDRGSDSNLAVVAGFDVALPVTPRVSLVPSFRLLMKLTGGNPADPLERDTATGALAFRYGAGVRAAF